MTYEEALIYLDDIETDVIYKITGNEREAINIAVQAIEKQIPKKPKMDNDNGIYEVEVCPYCMRRLFPNEHHCKCGQALDWSE